MITAARCAELIGARCDVLTAIFWARRAGRLSTLEAGRSAKRRGQLQGAYQFWQLALVWGVDCVVVSDFQQTDEMVVQTVQAIRPYGLHPGDKMIITAGVPFGTSGQTNLIQVYVVT